MADPTPSVERRIEDLLERMLDVMLRLEQRLVFVERKLAGIESVAHDAQRSEGWPTSRIRPPRSTGGL